MNLVNDAFNASKSMQAKPARKRRWRRLIIGTGVLLIFLTGLRLALPSVVRARVIQIINQGDLYKGEIQNIHINLWRGAYTIDGIKISKTTGNVPVPFIEVKTLDLSIEWKSILHGTIVGELYLDEPIINFVDAPDQASSQVGGKGAWLEIITDLFPVQINTVAVHNGSVTFHAYHKTPQVSLHASQLNVRIDNLTNVRNEARKLITHIVAEGLVMDHAKFQSTINLDPFSYYPTFDLRFRLLGLEVKQLNDLTRAYGMFDYEAGWFDLVMQITATEGQLEGEVTPLFRHVTITNVSGDLAQGNVIKLFWEALIGSVVQVFKNQPRDQFGTRIPVEGTLKQPQPEILTALVNVLHNAFIRAYLPKLPPDANPLSSPNPNTTGIIFKAGSIVEPGAPGEDS